MTLLFFAKTVFAVCGIVAMLTALAVFVLAITGNVPKKDGSRYEYEPTNNDSELV